MDALFTGFGTVINLAAIVGGSLVGIAVGHRLGERTRSVVVDCLGLVTLLVAGLSAVSVTEAALVKAVGPGVPVLIVLGSLVIGSVLGSMIGIESRLERVAGALQTRLQGRPAPVQDRTAAELVGSDATPPSSPPQPSEAPSASTSTVATRSVQTARERFIEGWLTTSLLFCVGPLTVLGALSDGLGLGIDQLLLKSALDGFSAIAFASTFGIGVLLSAGSVALVQGLITLAGVLLGSLMPQAHIFALTATGALLLVGISLRLLQLRQIPIGDMLPALLVAPLLTQLAIILR